jgi:hypothetical protein
MADRSGKALIGEAQAARRGSQNPGSTRSVARPMSSSPRRADHRSGQGCASEKAEDKDQGYANHSRSSFSMQRANDDTAIFVFIGDRRNGENATVNLMCLDRCSRRLMQL